MIINTEKEAVFPVPTHVLINAFNHETSNFGRDQSASSQD